MKKVILLITLILTFSTAFSAVTQNGQLTLGFMPYLASQHLLVKYQPLADYLSKELGMRVVIEVAKDYVTHNEETGKDELDISFLGGSPYIDVCEQYGCRPILARFEFNGRPYFRSVIYTAEKSRIKTLKELEGKRMAFGSRKSTLSTQVPYFMMLEAGVTMKYVKSDFVDNQENVVLGVLLGDYDAGSASEEVFMENRKLGLRAIAYSPYVSTHVFTASSKMPRELRERIINALLTLKTRPEGAKIMKSISPSLTGFVTADDSDYDLLRSILHQVLPVLEK